MRAIQVPHVRVILANISQLVCVSVNNYIKSSTLRSTATAVSVRCPTLPHTHARPPSLLSSLLSQIAGSWMNCNTNIRPQQSEIQRFEVDYRTQEICGLWLATRQSDRGRFLPLGKKASSYRGAYRVPLFNQSVCLSCLSVYV